MTPHDPSFNQLQPDQAIAICTREQAEQLVHFDHHQVTVSERIGILLTAEWQPIEAHVGPFILTVVFHHVQEYPPAPESIQAMIDTLKFKVRGQAR